MRGYPEAFLKLESNLADFSVIKDIHESFSKPIWEVNLIDNICWHIGTNFDNYHSGTITLLARKYKDLSIIELNKAVIFNRQYIDL